METTIMGYIGILGYILGIYWDNGKENGNYYSILVLYWENGKENGNYYSILVETTIVYWCYIGIMEKKMETTIVYWSKLL